MALTNTHNPKDRLQGGGVQRLRNELRSTLVQPRRRQKHIKMASLNMNGRGDHSQDKWGAISNTMKRHQVAILVLQETHPSNDMKETIGRRFQNTLHIVHSADPCDPNRTVGVSFAIHKGLIDTKNTTYHQIIPGQVILLEITWNDNNRIWIKNIYTLTRNTEKTAFWHMLLESIRDDESLHPDITMGNFNIVKNPELDRLNNRRGADLLEVRNTLADLTIELDLVDR